MEELQLEIVAEKGNPLGIIRYGSYDWQGIQYKIPRSLIFSNEETVTQLTNQTCVYILAGESEGKIAYYIGEAENCITRIKQHKTEDWWNEVLIFLGSGAYPLDKAQVKYIENVFYADAKLNEKSKMFVIMNANTPTKSTLSPQSESRTKKYIQVAKKLTLLQNLKLFYEHKESLTQCTNLLSILRDGKTLAKGYRTENGFVVIRGAICCAMTDKTTPCFKNFRAKLINDGIIKADKLAVDYEFSSPSAAAVQILGHNANGLDEWKDSNGKKLKDLEK